MKRLLAGLAASLWLAGIAAAAELDETCVVSILNRTVTVGRDGTWVLPNVPANIGRVRARATCAQSGRTRSGQSAYFNVPPNGIVDVPHIDFDDVQPVPALLRLAASNPTLTAPGATSQLLATATYPGGSTADVTAAATGTNYTISNAQVATLSADGLVTALRSGTVLVTALNDGATALLRLSVVLSGDTDGDGIPDDVEIANGLNPNDPIDAIEDYDGDGLVNRDEIARGTGLRDADSDDDGLSDGREVELGTEPLLQDTDGDGLGDKLEVDLGTNPLDANDYDLARALASITVAPPNVLIVRNTLLPEASRRIRVTGHLIDGRTLDLTSTQRRTQYASSDLTVASFGAVDGEIFAGRGGSAVVTVTNSGHNVPVPVTVREFPPAQLSSLLIPGVASGIDVRGDYAYVTSSTGLHVVDVSDRRAPRLVASRATLGSADDVRLGGDHAYVAVSNAGLQVFDVSDPRTPESLWSVDTPGTAQGVAVDGDRVYVADGSGGLRILSVSERREIGSYTASGTIVAVDVTGTTAVLAGSAALHVVDVSTPNAPILLGTLAGLTPAELVVEGSLAYVANNSGSLVIVDFATPSAPQRLHGPLNTSTAGMLADVAKRGPFTFGADFFFVNGVPIMDVSDPRNPTWRTTLNFPPRDDNGKGIAVDARYIYLVGNTSGGALHIGQYLEITDDGGVPPNVAVTAPAPGSIHVEGSRIRVTVAADDDVAVGSVTLLVDGVPALTDSSAPYEFDLDLPVGVTSTALSAVASDLGGNSRTSSTITLSLVPDPPPTVALVSPAASVPVMEGSFLTLEATASDNVAVARVRFLVNDVEVAVRTVPPYTAVYRVPLTNPPPFLTFAAEAIDNIGKTARVSRDHAVGPSLGVVPAPLAVPPDGIVRPFTIRLSRTAVVDHTVAVSSHAPNVARVSPATVTILAGRAETTAQITGVSAGSTMITLAAPTLGTTQVPVFVNAEFVGLSTSHAAAVGVALEEAGVPTPPVPVDRLFARMGVAVGGFIAGLSPAVIAVGSTEVPLVISGRGLDAATAVLVVPDDGVTLGAPVASGDGQTLTVPISVASDAAPTLRQVVVRDGSGQAYPAAGTADRLLITRPLPEVTSVSPLFVTRGATGLTLLVRGRHLVGAQSVQITPSAGIAVGTPVVSTDGTALSAATVNITVAPDAPLGPRTVTVTTPAGASDTTLSPRNTLTVVNELRETFSPIEAAAVGLIKESDPSPPETRAVGLVSPRVGVARGAVVTGLVPRAASIGQTFTLRIAGRELQGATEVRFAPNTGISVAAPAVRGDGLELTVVVGLDPDAPQVLRTVEVLAGNTVLPVTSPAASQFLVTTPLPQLLSVSPIHLPRGAPLAPFTIRGRHFRNTQQVRVVPADGVTLSPPEVNAAEDEITVNLSAAASAALGPRIVVVSTAAGETPSAPTANNTIQLTETNGTTYAPVAAPRVGVLKDEPEPTPVPTTVGPVMAPPVGVVLTATPTPPVAAPVGVFAPTVGAALGAVATRLEPAGAVRGASLSLVVHGHSLWDVSSLTFAPSTGITTSALQVNGDGTELTVTIGVADTAPLDFREMVLLDGTAGRILFADPAAARFYIAPGVPEIDSIEPILGAQGAGLTLTVRGRNLQGATAVTAAPAEGLTVTFPITVNAAGTQLTVPLRIAPDAALGPRVIRIVTPAAASTGNAAPANTFTVLPP